MGTTCRQRFLPRISLALRPLAILPVVFAFFLTACGGGAGGGSSSTTSTPSPTPTPSSYTLQVNKTGTGTVTSSPSGINCGSTCSASYASGTSVTLTAAAGSGYTFSGWSGSGVSCPGTGSCTVSMTAARSVVVAFMSNNTADLCNGLVTDKLNHPMTALAKPAVGQTVVDPEFGTTIRRITNAGGTGVIKPAYSTIPAWNADESYLILYHTGASSDGHHLYNGKTYQHIRLLDINPPDLEQFYWHTSDPDILFYVNSSNKTLTRYHVSTGTKEAVHTFSSCGGSISGGTDPMFMSWDSDTIGLRCSSGYVFTYRISTNTMNTTLSTSSSNAPIPSASGTMVFFANGVNAEVRDLVDLNLLRVLNVDPDTHASLGRLTNGHDTHNAVSFDGSYQGTIVTFDMTDGTARVVVGPNTGYPYPPSGEHISALAFKKPGWVSVSIVGDTNGQTLLNNEVVLADTNAGGKVCRVAHHRSHGKAGPQGYWAEPHAVISPSGTRILFGSDWGGGASVDTYVVELPTYVP